MCLRFEKQMRLARSRLSGSAVLSRLTAISWRWSIILCAVALGLIFLLDRATHEAPVEHLYYVPLLFAALRFGTIGGAITAVGAVGLYHVANVRFHARGYDRADLLQIAIFAGVPLLSAKLADDARRLRQLASTDDLTGLSNLRGFEHQLASLYRQAQASERSLSMLVLDLDGLKALNELHGHIAGADAVRTVGRVIADLLPENAIACRYGGDEFAVATPAAELDAQRLAESIVERVKRTAPVLAGRPMKPGTLSVSVGVASRSLGSSTTCNESHSAAEALFRAADRALYVAKAEGKGRAAVATFVDERCR